MSEVIKELKEAMQSGTNIFIYNLDEMGFLNRLVQDIKERHRNILIWSRQVDGDMEKVIDRMLSAEEMSELLLLYRRYEFTDKLIFISDDLYYPNILNYVRQGLLSKEEVTEALL